jgi:two-component system chemotaxis response regulator CheB
MAQTRVLIVDDSAAIRGVLRKIVESSDSLIAAGTASNGRLAVEQYRKVKPDIVIMDVEMPEMNGIDALKAIMDIDKTAKVLMCSTLTSRNASTTIEALRIGAVDYIQKPTSANELYTLDNFKNDLLAVIRSLGFGVGALPSSSSAQSESQLLAGVPVNTSFSLKSMPPLHWKPKILAVGSSTGGPQALFTFLSSIKNINLPVVITQHMPSAFTETLAKQITSQTGFQCIEARDGMLVEKGKAILAKGGTHLSFEKNEDHNLVAKLEDGPMENFCKPSVDVMLRSLAKFHPQEIMIAMLTGMGADGEKETTRLVNTNGAYCIAQNQETSVVWGMPGAVAKAGVCSAVLPLNEMGSWISNNVNIRT